MRYNLLLMSDKRHKTANAKREKIQDYKLTLIIHQMS